MDLISENNVLRFGKRPNRIEVPSAGTQEL